MDRDLFREEIEVEVNSIPIHRPKELILPRELTHHQKKLIVPQQGPIRLLHEADIVPEVRQAEEVVESIRG